MKALIREIIEQGGKDLVFTEAGIRQAAKKLGYSDTELDALFQDFDGFPLDDDDLADIAGGMLSGIPTRKNMYYLN
jgi:hypothetical protein